MDKFVSSITLFITPLLQIIVSINILVYISKIELFLK